MARWVSFLTLVACGGAALPPPPQDPATLSQLEADVLSKSCRFSSCHVGDNPPQDLNLEPPAHAKLVGRASTQVPARLLVAAGDSSSSYLMDKLLDRNLPLGPDGDWTSMPQTGGPLDAARIELVRSWIDAGAKDN